MFEETLRALTTIGNASGKNSKEYWLARHDAPLLRKVLYYAYNPHLTYGVSDSGTSHLTKSMNKLPTADQFFSLLDRLASRELSGNAARNAVHDFCMTYGAIERLLNAILKKDMNIGISTTTINAVYPGLIPTFKVQLSQAIYRTTKGKRVDSWHKLKFPCFMEKKEDGKRIVAFVTEHGVRMYSRTGHEQTGYENQKAELLKLRGFVDHDLAVDGELMFGMFGDRKSVEDKVPFVAFDVMPLSAFIAGKNATPFHTRRRYLADMIDFANEKHSLALVRLSEGQVCSSREEAEAWFEHVIQQPAVDGIMLKPLNGTYNFKRDYTWMKLKPEEDADLPIVRIAAGELDGKYAHTAGKVYVDYSGVEVGAMIATDDGTRDWLWDNRDWLQGRIAEIRYMEETPDGSLRHAKFVKVRDDK